MLEGDGSPDAFAANIESYNNYYAFGMEMPGRSYNSPKYRYGYNGKEKDPEGMGGGGSTYDYGFRIYNPNIGKFLSVDPLTKEYPDLTPYQFASNMPIAAIDLDGLEALLIVFPDYKVDPEIQLKTKWISYKAPKLPLGHAGVLIIKPSGSTKYFEYGRYNTGDQTKGKVRKIKLDNDIVFGSDGKPTNKSLNNVLGEISRKSGQGGRIKAAYIITDQTNKMIDYATEKLKESDPAFSDKQTPYDKNREPYDVEDHNCGTFAEDVILQDEKVDKPWVVNPTPNNLVEEYIEEGNSEVNYDPKTNKTTVEEGDESDAKKSK